MADGTLPPGEPDRTLAWGLIDWGDAYLIQPDGPKAGQRWVWTTPQLRFLLWFYAVDEHGRYIYRRAAMRWSKGRGKSPALAGLALAEFCGPVEFSHLDKRAPGGCVGRPRAMPWVQVSATAEDQCVNTMAMILGMTPPGSPLVRDYGLDVGKTITYRPGGARLQQITSSARAAEGARPTFVVMEEPQEWLAANGGHALAAVIRRNLAKTGGRSVEAGNAPAPGLDSVAERTLAAWQAQAEGRTRGEGILYDCVEAPPGTRLDDEKSLRAGLQVAYAGAPWVDIDRIIGEIWDADTPPDVSRRYYLNQVTAAEDAWCTPHEFGQLADPSHVVPDGAPVALFFDGSKSGDATGLVACEIESGGHVLTLGCWEPQRGREVDIEAVDATVAAAFDRYEVCAFFADVREWEEHAKVTWPNLYGGKDSPMMIKAVPGGKDPQPIAWDMRSRAYEFTMACELCAAEISSGAFTHDGNQALARHVANAHRRVNRWGTSIGKESRMSSRKIDLAVCMVGARMARRLVLASPAWQKRSRRKPGRGRVVVLT